MQKVNNYAYISNTYTTECKYAGKIGSRIVSKLAQETKELNPPTRYRFVPRSAVKIMNLLYAFITLHRSFSFKILSSSRAASRVLDSRHIVSADFDGLSLGHSSSWVVPGTESLPADDAVYLSQRLGEGFLDIQGFES